MEYKKFKGILDKAIFEKSKINLLQKVAASPNRYIGIFRPTKPKTKLLQNLLQSHEIRYGAAFEVLIEEYLIENNFEILNKEFIYTNGDKLKLDQFFKKGDTYYFIEQKIRDDHDSTKKRGQIRNFEKKLEVILQEYEKNIHLIGFMYFIDPNLIKNKNYYASELEKMSKDNVELHICYGKELFDRLNISFVWEQIIEFLEKWKAELPDIPEINFDVDPERTFEEIKDLSPSKFQKLIENDKIYNEILLTLFPEKKVLKLLYEYFKTHESSRYRKLANILEQRGIK